MVLMRTRLDRKSRRACSTYCSSEMKTGKRSLERCVQQNFSVFLQSLLGSRRVQKECGKTNSSRG